MSTMVGLFKGFNKIKLVKPLTIVYFFIAFVEIIAELNQDSDVILLTKPLLMPLLIAIYGCLSRKNNQIFTFSLLAAWVANILLISSTMPLIFMGGVFFLIYRISVISQVIRVIKFPGFLPMAIGCMPFLFMYLFIANLTHQAWGESFMLFIVHGCLLILFGGFCLGSYILKSSESNTYLLISTVLITAAQFLILINLFFASYVVVKPLLMLCFVCGQYLLCKFMVLEERKKKRYKSIYRKE